jgi:nicotinamide-nucleotide amidase
MAKSAAIVIIGDELLSGTVQDTNSSHIVQKLAERGVEVKQKSTIPDDSNVLEQELRRLVEKYDVVITSGGLGTTHDDITKRTVARLLGRKLVLKNRIVEDIDGYFRSRGEEMPFICYSQALIPEGAFSLKNPRGTAPGLAIDCEGKWLIALPGVPSEMEVTLEGALSLLPEEPNHSVKSKTLRTTGIAESRIQTLLENILSEATGEVGFLPGIGGVDIRLSIRGNETYASDRLKALEEKILGRIDTYVYGRDGETLEEVVGHALGAHKFSLSVAESCTGGLVKHRITNVSGSSDYFLGGVVAYHNDVKRTLLGVPDQVLTDCGAVSKETAMHMAEGVRKLFNSDIGVGVTGIAGPTGGTLSKPVGLVYLGLSTPESTQYEEHRFTGERIAIKEQSAQACLDMLRRHLTAQ